MALNLSLSRYPQLSNTSNIVGTWGSMIKVAALNDKLLFDGLNTVSNSIDSTNSSLRRLEYKYSTDFLHNNLIQGQFIGAAVSGGTFVASNVSVNSTNHPGTVIVSGANASNSGYRFTTDLNSLLLGGNEVFDLVFFTYVFTDKVVRFGFHDSASQADASDGAYLEVESNGLAYAKTAIANVRSSAAMVTLAVSTWYHFRVSIGTSAAYASFQLFAEDATVLASVNVSTNIPSTTNRYMAACALAVTYVSATGPIVAYDYMALRFDKSLQRGSF